MEDLNKIFDEYLSAFKNLDTKHKRTELINSTKEISALIEHLALQANINLYYLKSNEILEFNNGNETEDDFLEALLVYIENSKNLLGQYLDKITE